MRNAVAGEEALQADDAAGILRPDQHRTADAALDQADPAQDQRAHDALAEIGFGDQERAQSLRRNQQRFDVAFGMAVDQRDAARELADLGEKLTRPLIDHRRDMAKAVALGDRDMAGQHHEHAGSGLAGLEQPFAVLVSGASRRTGACARSLAASASGKVCSRRGNALSARRCHRRRFRRGGHSHLRLTSQEGSKTCRGPNPAIRPAFLRRPSCGAAASSIGRCGRDIVSSPRLRFSPLEVFAQRLLQPVPPCDLSYSPRPARPSPFVLVVRHRDPLACVALRRIESRRGTWMGENAGAGGPDGRISGTGSAAEPAGPRRGGGADRADFADFSSPAGRSRACAGRGLVARIGPPVGAVLADSPDPGMLP